MVRLKVDGGGDVKVLVDRQVDGTHGFQLVWKPALSYTSWQDGGLLKYVNVYVYQSPSEYIIVHSKADTLETRQDNNIDHD